MDNSDSNTFANIDNLMLNVAMHTNRLTQPIILASYYSVNKRDDAVKIVKEIVRDINNRNKTWAYNLWGKMLVDHGKYDEAINKYNLALNEDPKFVIVYNSLGYVYYSKGDYSKAKEYYEKAIDINPQHPLAYYNLGNVYSDIDYDKRDYSKAKEYYEKVIDLDPQFPAFLNLGFTYENEGNYSKAKEMYEKVIEIDPDGQGKAAREQIKNLPK